MGPWAVIELLQSLLKVKAKTHPWIRRTGSSLGMLLYSRASFRGQNPHSKKIMQDIPQIISWIPAMGGGRQYWFLLLKYWDRFFCPPSSVFPTRQRLWLHYLQTQPGYWITRCCCCCCPKHNSIGPADLWLRSWGLRALACGAQLNPNAFNCMVELTSRVHTAYILWMHSITHTAALSMDGNWMVQ